MASKSSPAKKAATEGAEGRPQLVGCIEERHHGRHLPTLLTFRMNCEENEFSMILQA